MPARLSWLVPGHDPREGDVPAEGAAEAVAQPPRAAARCRDRVPRSRAPADASRSPTRCAAGCGRALARRRRRTCGTASRCRPHLAIEVRVVDAAGRELAAGRDLAALRAQLGRGRAALVRAGGAGARAARARGLGLRRPARDADDRRSTVSVSPATRRSSTTATACRSRCSTRARRPTRSTRAGVVRLIRIALKDVLVAARKGRRGVRAGGAAAEDDRFRRTRCWPTCWRPCATARSSATIRCRDPRRRSPSR